MFNNLPRNSRIEVVHTVEVSAFREWLYLMNAMIFGEGDKVVRLIRDAKDLVGIFRSLFGGNPVFALDFG